MTDVTTPVVGRPLADDMFADITTAAVTFQPVAGGGVIATFDDGTSPLTTTQVAQARIRMMTADAAHEQLFTAAYQALSANQDFLAIASPTNTQAVSQVEALTRQIDALIKVVLRLI